MNAKFCIIQIPQASCMLVPKSPSQLLHIHSAWNAEFLKAKSAIGTDRETQLEQASDMVGRELVLVHVTAVEDKLQKGVSFFFHSFTLFS